jgi:Ca2+-binding RTX toxin-like protein
MSTQSAQERARRIGIRFASLAAAVLLVPTVLALTANSAHAVEGTCQGITSTIVGTDNGEYILGTEGDDVISAGQGDDLVFSLGGNDVICGGQGNDYIVGGEGTDFANGGGGDYDVCDAEFRRNCEY